MLSEPVSILIITRDRREMLDRLLSDLAVQNYQGEVEIVVVEETDFPREIAGVLYVAHSMLNKGIAFARNMSVKHASHGMLVFIDDDCRVAPDWLENLLTPFEDQTVLGVQGGVTVPDGTNAIGWAETLLGFPGGGFTRVVQSHGEIRETREVSTLNAAYRKEAVIKAGGFSDIARFGGEDDLLAKRVVEQGRLLFVPKAMVQHEARGSLTDIWHWFVRRGKAEFEISQANLAPEGYGLWMLRSSFSIKILPLMFLGYWSVLPLMGGLAVILSINWWKFRWVLSQKQVPKSAWFIMPLVKISMSLATDVGRIKAWWET